MIYFDNAATSRIKPESVYDALNFYLREIGVSPGRGSYQMSINSSRMLYQSRKTIAHYFGLKDSTNVIFTKNSTEAINLFFRGFLQKGDHVLISCYEHNAVLRPLQYLKTMGIIDYTVIERKDLYLTPAEIFNKYANDHTRLLATTLASNLTGRVIFKKELFEYFVKKGIKTFVDSSQGAGKICLNMIEDYIDFLAFTGHKDLYAIPGVGGLCYKEKFDLEPFIQGGTGIHGELYTNPKVFPEGYEAGTLNMPAIWALKTAIEYIKENRSKKLVYEKAITDYFLEKLCAIERITVYDKEFPRVSTLAFNVDGVSSDKVVSFLDKHSICVRGGIHCAILAHEALNTVSTGAVRVSLDHNNTYNEINEFINVIKMVGEQ